MKQREVMVVCMLVMLMVSVTAGVGIKWEEESVLVGEGESRCMTYKVYNPWPEGSNVEITLSEELKAILDAQEFESVFVPADTASSDAIPVEFCFDVPKKVYERSCILGVLCKQTCGEDMKMYEGEVVVSSVPGGDGSGSATRASVTAPLRIRVRCEETGRDYTALYILIAVIALIGIYWFVRRKGLMSRREEPKGKKKKKRK